MAHQQQHLQMRLPVRLVNNDPIAYEFLGGLYQRLVTDRPRVLVLDGSLTMFFAASLSPAFAAVLSATGYATRTQFVGFGDAVRKALCRNGFLTRYGFEDLPDAYDTSIRYRAFGGEDGQAFSEYVEGDVLARSQMPELPNSTRMMVEQSIHEVRENTLAHSEVDVVHSGGQYFRTHKELCVSFVDAGVGIPATVGAFLGQSIDPVQAISWAVAADTTTRRGDVPGGIGLHRIQQFLQANAGQLLIVSGRGYWRERAGKPVRRLLSTAFPGTMVMMQINTERSMDGVLLRDLDTHVVF